MSIKINPQEAIAFIAKFAINVSLANVLPPEGVEFVGSMAESSIKGIHFVKESTPTSILLQQTIKAAIVLTFYSKDYEIPFDCRESLVETFDLKCAYSYLQSNDPFELIKEKIRNIFEESSECDVATLPVDKIAADIVEKVYRSILDNRQLLTLYTFFCTKSIGEKIDYVIAKTNDTSEPDCKLLNTFPQDISNIIYDRDIEVQQIEELLNNHNIVYIGGIEGIGKTTLVKKYVLLNREKYTNVLFLPYEKDFLHIFCDDYLVTISNFCRKIRPDNTLESDSEYFFRKLVKLKELVTPQTLFIIDGYTFNDIYYKEITSLNATFIFTTYHDVSAIGETLTLRKITDEKYIMKLFFDNYERKDINANDSNLRKLFEYFDYHTLTLILVAKQMRLSRCRPEDILTRIENLGAKDSLSHPIYFETLPSSETTYNMLLGLFRCSSLSDDELHILYFLCLTAPTQLIASDLNRWLKQADDVFLTLEKLRAAGWIEIDNKSDLVIVHPLIKAIVLSEYSFDPSKYTNFFSRFASEFSDFTLFTLPFEQKKYYAEIAYSVCRYINSIDEDLCLFCLRAARILSVGNYLEESLLLQSRIEEFLLVHTASDDKMAYLYYGMGWTYATQYRNRRLGLQFFKKAIHLLSTTTSKSTSAQTERVANIYADYGIVLCRNDPDQNPAARAVLMKALNLLFSLPQKRNDTYLQISWLYSFLAECYIASGDVDNAKNYILRAFALHKQYSAADDVYYCNILLRESMLQKYLGEYESALNTALQGYKIYINFYGQARITNIEHLMYIGDLYKSASNSTNKIEYCIQAEQCYRLAHSLACEKYSSHCRIINDIERKIEKLRK